MCSSMNAVSRFWKSLARSENSKCMVSDFLLASENVYEHLPVTHQAVKRISERRRSILLEEEVPYPREAIADDGYGKQNEPTPGEDRVEHGEHHEQTAGKVKPTADRVAMLRQIEWIEFRKAPELSFHSRSFSKKAMPVAEVCVVTALGTHYN